MKTWKLLAYWITASGRDRWRLSFPKSIQTIPCHLGSVGGKCRSATSWCLLWPKILDQLTWMLQCCVTPEMSLPRAVATRSVGAWSNNFQALSPCTRWQSPHDYSVSGVNDSCTIHTKLDLHVIDAFVAVVKAYFEKMMRCSEDRSPLAKT